MKIDNATVNINSSLSKIESLLLDFEQFPQTEILIAIRIEIQTVIQKMRKHFQLKNILAMLNESLIIISAAIEREIILDINSIDLLLHINDLISDVCNTEYNNINELNALSLDISNNYAEKARNFSKSISLLKRTSYLKFYNNEITKNKNDFNNKNVTTKTITSENPVVKNDKKEESGGVANESEINNFTNTVEINKNFDIKEITQLLSMLENTINKASDKTITLSDREVESILKTSTVLKNLANDNSVKLFDETNQQIDVINSFLNTLEEFTDNKYQQSKGSSDSKRKKKERIVSLNKPVEYNDVNYLISKTINICNTLNYHQDFKDSILSIKKELTQINSNINKIFAISNFSNENTNNYLKNMNININNTEHLLNNIDNMFSDKIFNANLLTNSIYNKLSEMRSKSFAAFTIGLKEYVDVIAESIGKKVNLSIENYDIQITADLWLLFENIIPTVLRHIIVCNIKNKKDKTKSKISISLKSNSGVIELIFKDNGRFFEVKQQIQLLKDIILMTQNSGGKVFFNSNEKNENTIIFRFQIENFLCNYIVLEANEQFYAVPADFCEPIKENDFEQTNKIHINSLFGIEPNNSQVGECINVITNSQTIKIACDKIIGSALLAPQRLTGDLSQIPFSLGAAQFGDKSVLLLDVEAIGYSLKKENLNNT